MSLNKDRGKEEGARTSHRSHSINRRLVLEDALEFMHRSDISFVRVEFFALGENRCHCNCDGRLLSNN